MIITLFVLTGCNSSTIKTVEIGPERVECVGAFGPRDCILMDGELFYDIIEGFNYEEGYKYIIKVKIEDVKNPPLDGSSNKYTLVEIISKE